MFHIPTLWILYAYAALVAYGVYTFQIPYILYGTLTFFTGLSHRVFLLYRRKGVDVNFAEGTIKGYIRWPLTVASFIALVAGTVWAFYLVWWYEVLAILTGGYIVSVLFVSKNNLDWRQHRKSIYDAIAIIVAYAMWHFYPPIYYENYFVQ